MLTFAGADTSSTALGGITHLLLKNPKALAKLADEVRGAFQSDDDITIASLNSLPYLIACINEGLRLYPAITHGMPRQVPRGGATIAGVTVPEKVRPR